MGEIVAWCAALVYVASPTGVPVVVGWLWSELMEYLQGLWPEFESLAPMWKRLIFGVVCVVVPVIAAALGVATCGWSPTWVDTFWPAVMAGLMALGTGTAWHTRKLKKVEVLPVPRKSGDDGSRKDVGW